MAEVTKSIAPDVLPGDRDPCVAPPPRDGRSGQKCRAGGRKRNKTVTLISIPAAEYIPNFITGTTSLEESDASPTAVVTAESTQGTHPWATARTEAPAGPSSRTASR